MNKIQIKTVPIESHIPCQGDIFFSSHSRDLYILANVGAKYVAISLEDGNYWSSPKNDKNEAIEGLKFFGQDCLITVEKNEKPSL